MVFFARRRQRRARVGQAGLPTRTCGGGGDVWWMEMMNVKPLHRTVTFYFCVVEVTLFLVTELLLVTIMNTVLSSLELSHINL